MMQLAILLLLTRLNVDCGKSKKCLISFKRFFKDKIAKPNLYRPSIFQECFRFIDYEHFNVQKLIIRFRQYQVQFHLPFSRSKPDYVVTFTPSAFPEEKSIPIMLLHPISEDKKTIKTKSSHKWVILMSLKNCV